MALLYYLIKYLISNSRKDESNYRNRKQISDCLGLEVRGGFTETGYRELSGVTEMFYIH